MSGNWNSRREPRVGIMLHYDGSLSDPGAVAWLRDDPRCRVSYNYLILDDGTRVQIAPEEARAWHAGVCRPSSDRLPYHDANSAFLGVAIAATPPDRVQPRQFAEVVQLCQEYFRVRGWSLVETWRIVGHETEAWPRGRKIDPRGPNPAQPVLDVGLVRSAVGSGVRTG